MEIQDNLKDELIFTLDLNESIIKQEKKEKKMFNSAIKCMKRLAQDMIGKKVGEC